MFCDEGDSTLVTSCGQPFYSVCCLIKLSVCCPLSDYNGIHINNTAVFGSVFIGQIRLKRRQQSV